MVTRPQTVTHRGTTRVWRSATTLIEANALRLSQTTNQIIIIIKAALATFPHDCNPAYNFNTRNVRQLNYNKYVTTAHCGYNVTADHEGIAYFRPCIVYIQLYSSSGSKEKLKIVKN